MLPIVFAASIVLSVGSEPEWQKLEVARIEPLVVRLWVRSVACLADEEWIGFEFENTSSEPIDLDGFSFRLDNASFFGPSGPLGSGGLASGDLVDLFPPAPFRVLASPAVIAPGSNLRLRFPSDYCSALMRLPWTGTDHVEARAFVELRVGSRWVSERNGHPFSFGWRQPNEREVVVTRTRLGSLLAGPERGFGHAHVLGALLRIPAIGDSVSVDVLLEAIARRNDPDFRLGRDEIARFVGERFAQDSKVVAFYRGRLEAYDAHAPGDLLWFTPTWDRSFVAPLIAMCDAGEAVSPAVALLAKHRQEWPIAGDAPRRLSMAVRCDCWRNPNRPFDPSEPADPSVWSDAMLLAQTGDRAMIPSLIPLLDHRERKLDIHHWNWFLSYPWPPLRWCDLGLEAILTLLGEDLHAAYEDAARRHDVSTNDAMDFDFEPVMTLLRDEMIAELRARL